MSHRREQIERELQRIIGKMLTEGLADPRISGIISVTGVSVSPDLRNATVNVSVLPETRQRATIQGLRHAAGHIQGLVGKEMRSRSIPHLSFKLDESLKKQASVLTAIREAVEEDQRRRGDAPADAADADAADNAINPDRPGSVPGGTSAHSEDDVT